MALDPRDRGKAVREYLNGDLRGWRNIDHGDGRGPVLEWNRSDPKPTDEELEPYLQKAEARRQRPQTALSRLENNAAAIKQVAASPQDAVQWVKNRPNTDQAIGLVAYLAANTFLLLVTLARRLGQLPRSTEDAFFDDGA